MSAHPMSEELRAPEWKGRIHALPLRMMREAADALDDAKVREAQAACLVSRMLAVLQRYRVHDSSYNALLTEARVFASGCEPDTNGRCAKLTAHAREAALVAALREIANGAPTEEPEIYEGDNHGDSYSSGWKRAAFFAAQTARAAIDSAGGAGHEQERQLKAPQVRNNGEAR